MCAAADTGSMDISYIKRRAKRGFAAYKLRKRCEAVLGAVRERFPAGKVSILDVGACDGRMLSYLKDRLPEADCRGVEPDRRFIDACEDGRIRLVEGGAERLPFDGGSFDAALMSSVIEHVPDLPAALKEVRRVLRPGGMLAVISVLPAYEKLSVFIGHKKSDHFMNYTLTEAAATLEAAGFRVAKAGPMEFWLCYNFLVGIK